MRGEVMERVKEVAAQIAIEKDPVNFMVLVEELNRRLNTAEAKSIDPQAQLKP